jgi:hypothetical protein
VTISIINNLAITCGCRERERDKAALEESA